MKWYVYIVRCKDASFYVGVTDDVQKRVSEHNEGISPTSYTHSRRPVELVYRAEFSEVTDAISWEKQIKRWSRAKKDALIHQDQLALEKLSKRRSGKPAACHGEVLFSPFVAPHGGAPQGDTSEKSHEPSRSIRQACLPDRQAHHDPKGPLHKISHSVFMRRCLELAARGRGFVGNGALVGAVLVRDGAAVGEGWHRGYGLAHAERDLLQKFDQQCCSSDVLYVNLEPCCHEGKTPPCTDIIIKRGVTTVVFGMLDPDPRVAGKGIAALREAGVTVIGPVLPHACAWFNRGFVTLRTKGRPWITLKKAQTRAGDVASQDGGRRHITTQEQNVWAHTYLRAMHDAVLVGIGTVIADNPLLNTRFVQDTTPTAGVPYKIVLDRNCDIPKNARLFEEHPERVIVVVDDSAPRAQVSVIGNLGARVLRVPCGDEGVVWPALWEALTVPRDTYTGITSVLVEGGVRTWDTFKRHGTDMEVTLVGV